MKKKVAVKTYVEIFKSERKTFPQGCCTTRIIPDKRHKKPKYRLKEWE